MQLQCKIHAPPFARKPVARQRALANPELLESAIAFVQFSRAVPKALAMTYAKP